MKIKKTNWALRLFFYKFLFKKALLPGYLGKPIYIEGYRNITIGKRVRIFPGLRLQAIDEGKITIGDNVSIAQNFHCTSKGNLVIGRNTTILGNVFITNIDHEYKEIGKHILEQPMIVKETTIGENCFIGYGASIQAGTILGKHCVVGTNAVVRGVFPDFSVLVGVPAKVIKRYDPVSKEWVKISGK